MSYLDIVNAVNIYGNTLNKSIADYSTKSNKLGEINDNTIYGRRQPYRGPNTFMGSSSRNIYGNEVPEVYDPRSMFQDAEGNWAKQGFLTNATKGIYEVVNRKKIKRTGHYGEAGTSKAMKTAKYDVSPFAEFRKDISNIFYKGPSEKKETSSLIR